MYAVDIRKCEEGYEIGLINHVAKNLREAELLVRNNFQVVPEEWSKLVADLEHTGRASIERSAGKLA